MKEKTNKNFFIFLFISSSFIQIFLIFLLYSLLIYRIIVEYNICINFSLTFSIIISNFTISPNRIIMTEFSSFRESLLIAPLSS